MLLLSRHSKHLQGFGSFVRLTAQNITQQCNYLTFISKIKYIKCNILQDIADVLGLVCILFSYSQVSLVQTSLCIT